MKIVLIDTGRGNHPGVVDTWREKLGLHADDTVSLLTWQLPREPLPVVEHLVFGPVARLRSAEPRRVPTASDAAGPLSDVEAATVPGNEPPAALDAPDPGEDDASLGVDDLAGQLSEVEAQHTHDTPDAAPSASLDAAPPAAPGQRPQTPTTDLPKTDPARLRHAAAWRINKARLAGRRLYRAGRQSLAHNDGLPGRTARRVLRVGNDNVAMSFALAAARSSLAAEVFRSADVVVPVDARSQRAAWILARRHAGPDVVVGFPAAARVVGRRRGA